MYQIVILVWRVRTDFGKSWKLKIRFPGLESRGIRYRSWKINQMVPAFWPIVLVFGLYMHYLSRCSSKVLESARERPGRSQNEDEIWRPKVCRPWTSCLEQSTCWAGCDLQTFHKLYSETIWKLICSPSRNWFSAFAAPFHICITTCEFALYKYHK